MTAIAPIVLTLSFSAAEFRVLQKDGPASLVLPVHHHAGDIEIPLSRELRLEILVKGGPALEVEGLEVEPFKPMVLDDTWNLYVERLNGLRDSAFSRSWGRQLFLEPLKQGDSP